MIRFIDDLLEKQTLYLAKTSPASVVAAVAAMQDGRTQYVLSMLRSPLATRTNFISYVVFYGTPGQKQLAAILRVFNSLSPTQQSDFIEAYKRRAAAVVGTESYMVSKNTYPPPPPPPPGRNTV